MNVPRGFEWLLAVLLLVTTALAGITATAGCQRRERVIRVETPGTDVDVQRDVDTGEVIVDIDDR